MMKPTTKIGHRHEKTTFEIRGDAIFTEADRKRMQIINPRLHVPPHATILVLSDANSGKHFHAFRVTKDLWASEEHFRAAHAVTISGWMYRRVDLPEDYPIEQVEADEKKFPNW